MKKLLISGIFILCCFLIGCKCRYESNTRIVGYDATECDCCGGFKIIYTEYDVHAKKYIDKNFTVKKLTGDLGKTLTQSSKFPVSGISYRFVANTQCTNVLDTLELYPPLLQCPK